MTIMKAETSWPLTMLTSLQSPHSIVMRFNKLGW